MVGGSSSSIVGSVYEAFRWTEATGMVGLGSLGTATHWSNATAVSADGSVVVGTTKPAEVGRLFTAFRWTPTFGMVAPSLPEGTDSVWGYGVSGDGSLALVRASGPSAATPPFTSSWLWTSAGDRLPVGGVTASDFIDGWAISANGNVVVGNGEGADFEAQAAYWTQAGGTVLLGHLPGANYISAAYSVSADGAVVVGSESNGDEDFDEAFRWRSSTGMVGLGRLPGATGSKATGVSGDGSILVGLSLTKWEPEPEAMIWTESGGLERLLDFLVARGTTGLDEWTLFGASGVSQDGNWVVGWGAGPTGYAQAFRANISVVPLPPAGLLLATGLMGVFGVYRRRWSFHRKRFALNKL